MVIRPFEFPDTNLSASRSTYVGARLAFGSLLSLALFFVLFLLSLSVLTRLIYLFIKLLKNATRSLFGTTNEAKQLTGSTKNSIGEWSE